MEFMKTLVNKQVVRLTQNELLAEINRRQSNRYATLAKAILGLGVTVAGKLIKKSIYGKIIEAIGIGMSVSDFLAAISDAADDDKRFYDALESLSKMQYSAQMQITTCRYLWQSGSLNHHAYIIENTYRVVGSNIV